MGTRGAHDEAGICRAALHGAMGSIGKAAEYVNVFSRKGDVPPLDPVRRVLMYRLWTDRVSLLEIYGGNHNGG